MGPLQTPLHPCRGLPGPASAPIRPGSHATVQTNPGLKVLPGQHRAAFPQRTSSTAADAMRGALRAGGRAARAGRAGAGAGAGAAVRTRAPVCMAAKGAQRPPAAPPRALGGTPGRPAAATRGRGRRGRSPRCSGAPLRDPLPPPPVLSRAHNALAVGPAPPPPCRGRAEAVPSSPASSSAFVPPGRRSPGAGSPPSGFDGEGVHAGGG